LNDENDDPGPPGDLAGHGDAIPWVGSKSGSVGSSLISTFTTMPSHAPGRCRGWESRDGGRDRRPRQLGRALPRREGGVVMDHEDVVGRAADVELDPVGAGVLGARKAAIVFSHASRGAPRWPRIRGRPLPDIFCHGTPCAGSTAAVSSAYIFSSAEQRVRVHVNGGTSLQTSAATEAQCR